jgi:hypothetical protein
VGHQVPRYLGTPQIVPEFVSDSLLYLGILFGKRHAIEYNIIKLSYIALSASLSKVSPSESLLPVYNPYALRHIIILAKSLVNLFLFLVTILLP